MKSIGEEIIFHRFSRNSLLSKFFFWKTSQTLTKREIVEGDEKHSAWQRLTKRQIAKLEPTSTQVQSKSQHSNWVKQGFVTG